MSDESGQCRRDWPLMHRQSRELAAQRPPSYRASRGPRLVCVADGDEHGVSRVYPMSVWVVCGHAKGRRAPRGRTGGNGGGFPPEERAVKLEVLAFDNDRVIAGITEDIMLWCAHSCDVGQLPIREGEDVIDRQSRAYGCMSLCSLLMLLIMTVPVGATSLEVNALVVNPATPATLYAGTDGDGIFKSTDGGVTWRARSTGLTNPRVTTLVIDPSTPATLYAGTEPAQAPTEDGGVFKSVDGGVTWSQRSTGLPSSGVRISVLKIDPATPSTLYAVTNGDGIFKSTDGGATWSVTGLPRNGVGHTLALALSTPPTLYGATDDEGKITKSTDGGVTWNALPLPPSSTVFSLAIDPATSTTLYAGSNGQSFLLSKSTDGGVTWGPRTTGLEAGSVPILAIDPASSTTVYAVSDRGNIFKTTDGGVIWRKRSTGLRSSKVWSLAIDPVTPTTLYAGIGGILKSGVFKSTDGANTWRPTGLTR